MSASSASATYHPASIGLETKCELPNSEFPGMKARICFISSIPLTLRTFYVPLMIRLRDEGYEVVVVASNGPENTFFRERLGIEVHELDISRAITPLRDFRTILKLALFLKRRRIDIVHAHTPKGTFVGMVASTLAGTPHRLLTLHGLPLETERGMKQRLLSAVERITLSLSHRSLVVSQSLRESVIRRKLARPESLVVLGHGSALGVDLQRFNAHNSSREFIRKDLGIAADEIVVGFVGRLVPDKGVEFIADSFSRLLKQPHLRLLVVGQFEPHRGVITDQAEAFIRSHPKVIYIPHSDAMEMLYSAMDIFVLPSAREGFGCVLLEAGAMGIPVIANRVTGCVDAVQDEQTGFLVPLGDRAAFEKQLLLLVENPELRTTLGKNARARAESDFSQEKFIETHLALYKSLMGGSAATVVS